jgi:predicted nucleic acid-binding protein
MFVLDTDVLSNLRKQKKHPMVQLWLHATAASDLSTTVITIAEIQCGIERQMNQDPEYASGTQRWLDGFLSVGGVQILTLGVPAALLLARMHETPSLRNFVVPDPKQKKKKTPADLAIAAIAIAEGATVATGNQAHFEEIHEAFPLPGIYNPFKDIWSVTPDVASSGYGS